MFLAPGSSLKGQSDMKKFEKARQLKQHVDRIRADYSVDLRDKEMAIRQRATAIYFIDRFALRNGNEKGEDEADTVGCCSLRFEHVTLTPPTEVTFDFLGKDSIRYVNSVKVDPMVFKNLKIFKKEPKQVGDLLFDRLSVRALARRAVLTRADGHGEQVPHGVHGRPHRQSLPNLQRLDDLCAAARDDGPRGDVGAQDSRVQSSEPTGRGALQPPKVGQQGPRHGDGEGARQGEHLRGREVC